MSRASSTATYARPASHPELRVCTAPKLCSRLCQASWKIRDTVQSSTLTASVSNPLMVSWENRCNKQCSARVHFHFFSGSLLRQLQVLHQALELCL